MLRWTALVCMVLCSVGLTTACGPSGQPTAQLAEQALDVLHPCLSDGGQVLGQIESIDVQLLWPLAPGEEGNVYRYQVRVVGQFGSNINVVMLYYKEDQWIAKMEGNENGVTTCSPDTLQWYQIRN